MSGQASAVQAAGSVLAARVALEALLPVAGSVRAQAGAPAPGSAPVTPAHLAQARGQGLATRVWWVMVGLVERRKAMAPGP